MQMFSHQQITGPPIHISQEQFKEISPAFRLILLTAKDIETELIRECFREIAFYNEYHLGLFGSYLALHCETGQGGMNTSALVTRALRDLDNSTHYRINRFALMLGMCYGLRRDPSDGTRVRRDKLLAFLDATLTQHLSPHTSTNSIQIWHTLRAQIAASPEDRVRLPYELTPDYAPGSERQDQMQQIGDVLISKSIRGADTFNQNQGRPWDYPLRSAQAFVSAADAIRPHWNHRMRDPDGGERTVRAYTGLMLAGNQVISNAQYRAELVARFPEAIGGEMEGLGLAEAIFQHHLDQYADQAFFMMIKGIMDWGVAKSDEMQRQAVKNSIQFALYLLDTLHGPLEHDHGPQESHARLVNLLTGDILPDLEDLLETDLAAPRSTREVVDALRRQMIRLTAPPNRVATASDDITPQTLRAAHFTHLRRSPELADLPPLIGREWLSDWVSRQEMRSTSNYIILEAPPGTGKSEFLRHWVAKKINDDAFIAKNYLVYYAIRPNTDTAESVIEEIYHQIRSQFFPPDAPETENTDVTDALRGVMDHASRQLKGDERLYIYVDSIDSVRGAAEETRHKLRNTLTHLPPGVVILLTSRPRSEESWATDAVMNIAQNADNNRADLELFIQQKIQELGLKVPEGAIQQIMVACAGCFGYAKHLFERPEVAKIIQNPLELPIGFRSYTIKLWAEAVPKFKERGIPEPVAKGLLGLISLSHKDLSAQDLTNIVQSCALEFKMPCFGRTSGTEYTIGDCLKYIESFLETARDFLQFHQDYSSLPSGKVVITERFRMFHNAFQDYVIDTLLNEVESAYCRLFLANYRSAEVRRFVYDDFSSSYTLEQAEFSEALTDLLIALSNIRDIPTLGEYKPSLGHLRYVIPVCWYLYGHYWWDEYDPSFPLCTQILEIMAQNQQRYKDEIGHSSRVFDSVLKELRWIRSNWPRVSIWRARRSSCSNLQTLYAAQWKGAQRHLDSLAKELALDIPEKNLDEGLRNADEFKAARAIWMNFRAETVYGQGDLETAAALYEQARPELEKIKFLDWSAPYSGGEMADVLLDQGRPKEAIVQIKKTQTFLEDHIGTDAEDHLATSEMYRFYGDLLWSQKEIGAALEADILSLYYMLIGHTDAGPGSFSDAYCQAFHRETAWSVMDRLSEVWESGQVEIAIAATLRLREFWKDYWTSIRAPQTLTRDQIIDILDHIPRKAGSGSLEVFARVDSACADILYPRVPQATETSYARFIHGLKENDTLTAHVQSLHDAVMTAVEIVAAA